MMRTLKELQTWAARYGYMVERTGRTYEWWDKSNDSIVGVCRTIRETHQEIHDSIRNDWTTMNIWAGPGDIIRFTGKNGSESDRKEAKEILDVGAEYEVVYVSVSSSSSCVKLKDIAGLYNTVMFKDVKIDKVASDIRAHNYYTGQ